MLAFDNNDDEDATSLDALSVSTTQTQHSKTGQKSRKSQSDALIGTKLDEQLNDDLKNIDEKRNLNEFRFRMMCFD